MLRALAVARQPATATSSKIDRLDELLDRSDVPEEEVIGDVYELGQASETGIMDITLAHESAHLVLGADDEYADASDPGRTVYTDHSLLGSYRSEGAAAAEIKARHFGFAVKTVGRWFPGRAISIVR